ncbi:MAG: hypothetical protein ACJ8C4_10830 [Gemmataceae bacterium]
MPNSLRLLDHLLKESHAKREIHPQLKRMILAATQTALRSVVPDNYYQKCQGAAAAIFMILRTLRIRSTICGGTVSWLFGGVDKNGVAWQSRCGFWSHNPNLPTPHAWVITEFGGLVDLTCAYFDRVIQATRQGMQSHDILPMIWMKTENLEKLPTVQYNMTAKFDDINLDACDELARRVVGTALAAFWGKAWIEAVIPADMDPEKVIGQINFDTLSDASILDGPKSLEELREINDWVARNSPMPGANALAATPTA